MTTGQPIRFPSDKNKYNNEFMESLQMQINLNQKNLEVNRLYKETGQLPASTQMMDTRSNEEKLMDVEYLKKQIISDLKPIAEPMFASSVIQGVINSPLNVNNSLFRYLAQNAQTFAQTLSKKYKFGIAGDANDVAIMVQFLEDAYNKTQNTFQSIKGYINSNTNADNKSRSNILSANDTDNIIVELKDILKKLNYAQTMFESDRVEIRGIAPRTPALQAQIRKLAGVIEKIQFSERVVSEIISFLPNSQQMSEIINNIQTQVSQNINDNVGNPRYERDIEPYDNNLYLNTVGILKTLPKLQTIQTLSDRLEKSMKRRDVSGIDGNLDALQNIFAEFYSNEVRDTLLHFRDTFIRRANDSLAMQNRENSINYINQMRVNSNAERAAIKAQRVYIVNPPNDAVYVRNRGDGSDNGSEATSGFAGLWDRDSSEDGSSIDTSGFGDLWSARGSSESGFSPPRSAAGSNYSDFLNDQLPALVNNADYIDQQVDNLDDGELTRLYAEIPMAHARVPLTPALQGLFNHPNPSINQKKYACSEALKHAVGRGGNAYDPQNGRGNFGIQGLGLGKKVKKGRGLYSPFGDSEINHKNLENNILTLRRKSKTNYMDLPSKHISKHMKNIIHNIIGGKIANFEDINNLNDEERNYLNKVISKSNLQDRLSVPAPSKDQADKDNHQWEVMRGEIMAGNDSHELVKKFKILTMKLTRQGLLPKNEVMELFEDLVNLGY